MQAVQELLPFLYFSLFIFASLVFTYILKRFKLAETHIILSLVRSQKFRGFIERRKNLGGFALIASIIAIALGFGVLGIAFLLKGRRKIEILLASIANILVLYTIYSLGFEYAISVVPVVSEYGAMLSLLFSIFGFSMFMFALFILSGIYTLQNIIAGATACPGVAPILPGVPIPKVQFFLPLYAWIPLAIAIILHEMFHGIVSLRFGIKLKSAGIVLLGFLPMGAFVEPDEEKLKAAEAKKRSFVYAAGPGINCITAFLLLLIVLAYKNYVYTPVETQYMQAYEATVDYVEIVKVPERLDLCNAPRAPAYGKLKEGMILLAIDGNKVKSVRDAKLIIASNRFAARTFTVRDGNKIKNIYIKPDPVLGMFGFYMRDVPKKNASVSPKIAERYALSLFVLQFLYISFLLSFLLFLANVMPIPLLDGKAIFSDILSGTILSKASNKELLLKWINRFLLIIFLASLIPNVIPYFL